MKQIARLLVVFIMASAGRVVAWDNPDTEELINDLRNGDAAKRALAARMVGRHGLRAFAALPELVKALRDPDEQVRVFAGLAIGAFGPKARSAVPALIDALDPQLRGIMFHALGRIGAKDPDTVKFLRKALLDPEYQANCGSVAAALADLGPVADSAVPELIAALKDKRLSPSISYSAIYALAKIGPGAAKQAMPVLMDMLRSPNQQTADDAVNLLRFMGEAAAPAVPILLQELPRPESRRRSNAIYALSRIGWPAAEALLKIAEQKNPTASQIALSILGQMEHPGKKALPALLRLVQGEDVRWRTGAARALGKMGRDAAEAIPHLLCNLESATDGRSEIEALGRIGGNDPRVRSCWPSSKVRASSRAAPPLPGRLATSAPLPRMLSPRSCICWNPRKWMAARTPLSRSIPLTSRRICPGSNLTVSATISGLAA